MPTPSMGEKARMARLQAMDRAQADQREREQEKELTKVLRKSYQRQLRRNEELRNRISELERLLEESQGTQDTLPAGTDPEQTEEFPEQLEEEPGGAAE